MTNHNDPLARAENSAREWLATIGHAMGTRDRRYTYRVMRAWMHALRDRLTVEGAAHFSAQLPELLRGTFYDGWVPSRVPMRYSSEDCIDRIAEQATVRRADVRTALRGVSTGMTMLLSAGALEHALEQLPRDLRTMFAAEVPVPQPRAAATTGTATQLRDLRERVELLADAVATLARGFDERAEADQPIGERGAEAAQAVNRMMLTRQTT
jgi:uncharacterized protein (DUF2267 family)